MMNILHVTATHLRPEGGVPVVLKNLVSEQNKLKNCCSKVISLVAPVDEMKCLYFEFVKNSELRHFLLEFNPDVVILHSFFYVEYNSVVKILLSLNIPYYIEPHGSFGRKALQKSYFKKMIANNTVFRKLIKGAKGFIFLNDSEKNDSKFRSDYDLIIPNGIDSKKVVEIHNNKENYFYFIGRYDIQHKGLDYFFNALDILDKDKFSINILMYGKGDSITIDFLNKKIKSYSYVNVSLNQSIFGIDKDNQLEQLGPMILTSRYEGFPMTILEAWSYGNPCLVTKGTNVYDEVVENGLGWGTKLDSFEIASTIKKAVYDYQHNREQYILNTKNYVKNRYNWESIARISLNELNKYIHCEHIIEQNEVE